MAINYLGANKNGKEWKYEKINNQKYDYEQDYQVFISKKNANDNHSRKSYQIVPNYFILLFYILLIILLTSLSLFMFFFWFSSHSINSNNQYFLLNQAKNLVLINTNEAPQVIIEDDQVQATTTNDSCNHYNCFDVYRCGDEGIKVFVYPNVNYIDSNQMSLSNPHSEEFYQLIKAIIDSPYFTWDPSKACLFIPNIDLLSQNYVKLEETSQILAELSHWNTGKNHLIFNMIPGSFPDYNTRLDVNLGNAMIAGGGFSFFVFRKGFDISIPVYSHLSQVFKRKMDEKQLMIKRRHWFLIATQFEAASPRVKQLLLQLEQQHSSQMLLLRHRCLQVPSNGSDQLCNELRSTFFNYPQILTDATFCLVTKTAFLGHPLLSDVLMSGCVPVIISEEYVLPFEEKIDWKSFSVRIGEYSFTKIFHILMSISEKRINQMKHEAFVVWKKYFSSMRTIGLTTLRIISERLFPQFVESKNFNVPFFHDQKEHALISSKLTSRQNIGFTAVILTYDRLESLFEVIRCIKKVPSCIKIVVVWNNQHKKPPPNVKWPKTSIPLQIIKTKHNRLSNRFYPYQHIGTDSILAIDDDIIMLTPDELEFGYQVWKEFPDRIVGFPSRVHHWDNATSKWKYESEWTNNVSMVLTGAAFYHKVKSSLFEKESSLFEKKSSLFEKIIYIILLCSIIITYILIICQKKLKIGLMTK